MPLNLKITGEIMASIKNIKLHIVLFWAVVLAAGIFTLQYSTGSINTVVAVLAAVGFIVSIVKSYKKDGFGDVVYDEDILVDKIISICDSKFKLSKGQ